MAWSDYKAAEKEWVAGCWPLVERSFAGFLRTGEWPSCDDLQRLLDTEELDVDVRVALDAMPRFVGDSRPFHPTTVQVPMRVLSHVRRARPLLNVVLAVLRCARSTYRSPGAELVLPDDDEVLRETVGKGSTLLPRAGQLINTEGCMPISAGGFPDRWVYSFSPAQIRSLPELHRLADFFDWQEAVLAESYAARGFGPSFAMPESFPTAGPFAARAPSRDSPVDALHAEVRDASGKLFDDEHYGPAVFEAFKAVEVRVRELTGLHLTGKDLMAKAFRGESPLIDLAVESGISGESEREGFRLLFMGAMAGIRNPKGHERIVQTDRQRTLEYLALASLLMRRLDDAVSGNE